MTTRLTDDVLANIHGDMQRGIDLHPVNNQLMAEILNRMDQVTIDGYDSDAAAAALFAYASVLGSHQITAPAGATHQDVAEFLATMATLTGQALHAQTHAVAEELEPAVHATVTVERVHAALALATRWPPDRREPIRTAVVGAVPEPYQLEALRQYRTARGLPGLVNVVTLTAAEVNQAVTWWNHRAAMLSMENPQ